MRTTARLLSLACLCFLAVGCGVTSTPPSVNLTPEQTKAIANSSVGVSLGRKDAPVTVIEFSDFQCPGCAQSAEKIFPELKQLADDGEIRYIFMDYPLPGHKHAVAASQAARCAAQQDKWVPMHDEIFRTQQRWAGAEDPKPIFLDLAKTLELDIPAFEACQNDPTIRAAITKTADEARRLKVNATPTLLINGKQSALNANRVRDLVEKAVKEASVR